MKRSTDAALETPIATPFQGGPQSPKEGHVLVHVVTTEGGRNISHLQHIERVGMPSCVGTYIMSNTSASSSFVVRRWCT